MGVEVTRDLWQSSNPIRFDPKKREEFVKKYKAQPYWANRKWRNERRGWANGLAPVRTDDPRFKELLETLTCPPGDIEKQMEEGVYRIGDSVLSCLPEEQYLQRQARRSILANRKLERSEKSNPVATELSRLEKQGTTESERHASRYIELYKPQLKQEKDGQVIRSGDWDASRNRKKSGGK
jgi:hypothetical protein